MEEEFEGRVLRLHIPAQDSNSTLGVYVGEVQLKLKVLIIVQDARVPFNWRRTRSKVDQISMREWLKVSMVGHSRFSIWMKDHSSATIVIFGVSKTGCKFARI